MKRNTIARGNRGRRLTGLAALLVLLVLLAAGGIFGFGFLRARALEQSALADPTVQVEIETGRMVKPDVILESFGLRRGANLATVDFAKKRADTLARYPMLRDIEIVRHLPDRLTVRVYEREPSVRLGLSGSRADTGRVADSEGMVFVCRRGTAGLPVIRENAAMPTPVGTRLAGRSLAALRLLECASDAAFQELGILEADASKHDYILAVLTTNYARAKFAWTGMDAPSEATRPNLVRQLTRLLQAVRTPAGPAARVWNVTDTSEEGLVYADTKETIE